MEEREVENTKLAKDKENSEQQLLRVLVKSVEDFVTYGDVQKSQLSSALKNIFFHEMSPNKLVSKEKTYLD